MKNNGMRIPSGKEIEMLKKMYPHGARVELVHMEDPQAPPVGTKGTVLCVDGMGDILINWDNGSGLNVVCGVDVIKIIEK